MSDQNKNRKYDRQRKSEQNKTYINSGRREVNKAHKIIAHLKRLARKGKDDPTARSALKKIPATAVRDAFRRYKLKGDWTEWANSKAAA